MKNKLERHGWLLYNCLFIGIVFCGYYILLKDNLSLIYKIDGVGQYYPAFIYIGQYIQNFFTNLFHGNFTMPLYDLSIGMGEDIVGVLNYYGFGDPLNILAVFVNKHNSAYIFSFMFFLRLWLSGITFQYYCHFMRLDRLPSILGALCYIFCGFAIYGGAMYLEWLAVLIYFPLILTGIEKIFSEAGKPYMLIFSVAYGALCGFYYLYMVSLFLVVYCIIRLLAVWGIRNIKTILIKCFICLGWYMVGICLAAPIFIPAIVSYINSERAGSGVMNIVLNIHMYIPRLNRSFIQAVFNLFHSRKNYLSGITFVQMIAALFLFILPRCSRRLQLQAALIISLIAMHLPITDYLFNGFGESNDRWVFVVHFIVSIVMVYVLSTIQNVEIVINSSRIIKVRRCTVLCGATVLIILNIIGNIWLLFPKGDNWKTEFISYDNFNKYVDTPYNYSDILKQDRDIYRISNDSLTDVNGRPENVAMLNNYYGLTYWFSIVNRNTQSYIDEITDSDLNWRSYGVSNNPILETMAGVKYYLRKNDENIPEGYELLEEIIFNGEIWQIYRNPHYLGMAYTRNIAESAKLWNEKVSYEEYFDSVLKMRSNQEQINFDYDNQTNIASCTVYTEQDSELVVLIPYSENWKAYVDGNQAEVCKTDIMYISIPIKERGQHKVILKYSPIGFKVGLGLMIMAIVIIIGRIFYSPVLIVNHKKLR